MSTRYLETSALLRMLFGESGGDDVQREIVSADVVVTSRLTHVETYRALLRVADKSRELEEQVESLGGDLASLWSRLHFFEVTRAICDVARGIGPGSLRTLDAIHLATFREARQIDRAMKMLTFDDRLLGCI